MNGIDEVLCLACAEPRPGAAYAESTLFTSARAPSGPISGPIAVAPNNSGSDRRMLAGVSAALGSLAFIVILLGIVVWNRSGPGARTQREVVPVADITTTTTTVTSATVTSTSTPSPNAAVTTVITLPPTTARASAERAPAGTAPRVLDALDVAQELATALANDDWTRVRQLEPAKSNLGDAQFFAQYRDLDASTAILAASSDQGGGVFALRLGLVAHQNSSQTSVYCVTWTVSMASRTLIESSSGSRTLADHVAGTLDPLSQSDRIRSDCRFR